MAKLTRTQTELLREIFNGEDRCSDAYRPAQKLVELGLCIWRTETRLQLTEAGREALKAEDGRHG